MKLDDSSYVSQWRRKWQLNEERRALATLGLDVDVALQRADAVVDDGQAQPESAVPEFAVATGMSPIEAAEDRLQLGFGDANAVVTNSYGADVGSLARRRIDLDDALGLVRIGVLDRVRDQIDEHELEPSDVGRDAGQRLPDNDVDVAVLRHLAKLLDDISH